MITKVTEELGQVAFGGIKNLQKQNRVQAVAGKVMLTRKGKHDALALCEQARRFFSL